MNTTFTPPAEKRRQICASTVNDRLVREKRQYITSISRSTAWKLEQSGSFLNEVNWSEVVWLVA
jgi:hypothetical protein